jgi:hypothetical protein
LPEFSSALFYPFFTACFVRDLLAKRKKFWPYFFSTRAKRYLSENRITCHLLTKNMRDCRLIDNLLIIEVVLSIARITTCRPMNLIKTRLPFILWRLRLSLLWFKLFFK